MSPFLLLFGTFFLTQVQESIIVDKTERLQGVALTVNTAALSDVSFRLESMQLNEYLVTYVE